VADLRLNLGGALFMQKLTVLVVGFHALKIGPLDDAKRAISMKLVLCRD
jgi:hypothetical protein